MSALPPTSQPQQALLRGTHRPTSSLPPRSRSTLPAARHTRCRLACRGAKRAASGAQYLLYSIQEHDTLSAALSDCTLSVAFTRWVAGKEHALPDIPSLISHPEVQRLLRQPPGGNQDPTGSSSSSSSGGGGGGGGHAGTSGSTDVATARPAPHAATQQQQHQRQQQPPPRIALVFGREDLGLEDAEVACCSASCSIPIGRLQVRALGTHIYQRGAVGVGWGVQGLSGGGGGRCSREGEGGQGC
jgi:hypothetical protein